MGGQGVDVEPVDRCRHGRGVRAPAEPGPRRTATEAVRSGVVQEARWPGLRLGGVAELGQRLVGAVPVLAELVDVAGFLAGGDLAAQLPGDAHQLTDGVGGGALLAELAPEGVLVAAAGCRPIAMAMVLIGSTLRMIVSSVSDAPSGTRRMNSIILYGLGPSKPPPMATQVMFSGPV